MSGKKCIDHEGNIFSSKMEMCRYWGIDYSAFISRQHLGWSLRDSLIKRKKNRKISDHLGNYFRSTSEMARAWGISPINLYNKLYQGWSIESALTKEFNKRSIPARDHKGNLYSSISDMCKAYGLTYGFFYRRFCKKGWNLQQTLETKPIKRQRGKK